MKPTRNQLLAACGRPLDLDEIDSSVALVEILSTLPGAERLEVIQEMTSYSEFRIEVEIKPRSETEQSTVAWDSLQVPIEPLKRDNDRAIAMAWCCSESRACALVPKEGHANLLVQAVRAQLHINRFEVCQVYDKSTKLTKEVQFLDRGSVLLAFELAGLPAPKSYDDWRLPDGDNLPLTATSSDASLGTMTVHYTNGELALVTSGDGMRAKVVHTKSLRSAAVDTVRGLSGRAEGASVRVSKAQLSANEAKSLASKFCKRMSKELPSDRLGLPPSCPDVDTHILNGTHPR